MAVSQASTGNELGDHELIEKAKNASNGLAFSLRFERTYDSPALNERYRTVRRAELALLCDLAWWTNGDREQMWRLFRTSNLFRPRIERYPAYKQELLDAAIELIGDDGYEEGEE